MAEHIQVQGYSFADEAVGQMALKEATAVQYIEEQVNPEHPEAILKLYQSLIERHFFHTVIGYDFLHKLRDILLSSRAIDPDLILPIETDGFLADGIDKERAADVNAVSDAFEDEEERRGKTMRSQDETGSVTSSNTASATPERVRRLQNEVRTWKGRFRNLLIVCFVLVAAVVAMFVISATSSNPTILDYETKIVDKYSEWEEELNARDSELREKERALDEREQALQNGGGTYSNE